MTVDIAHLQVQSHSALPTMLRENITMRIYRELRTRIMAGHFRPGESMTLRSVAESIGVSQTPVREALLQLVSEKVLSVSPGRSVRVPELTRPELEELGVIRTALECLAARYAVSHRSPALTHKLEGIQEKLIDFKRRGDITGVLEQNLQFHFTLYAASQLPMLVATIEGFWARTGPYIHYLYQQPSKKIAGLHPHQMIIEGLKRGSSDAVEQALARDIQANWEILVNNAFATNTARVEALAVD